MPDTANVGDDQSAERQGERVVLSGNENVRDALMEYTKRFETRHGFFFESRVESRTIHVDVLQVRQHPSLLLRWFSPRGERICAIRRSSPGPVHPLGFLNCMQHFSRKG
jgi:hypothetical protein